MSLLSWNCWGLRSPQTVNALKEVIRIEEPKIVFLMETKSDRDWMVKIRDNYGFKQGLIFPNRGSSGGFALFWKDDIQVNVIKYSPSNIDAEVNSRDGLGWWHLTSFYGQLKTSLRYESWSLLKYLSGLSQLPWLAIGDFNELMCSSEKEGGATKPTQQMQYFVDALNWCGLGDLGFSGPKFTWLYQQSDGTQIRERLDRVVAIMDWVIKFPQANIFHRTFASDHNLLVLNLMRKKLKPVQTKIFRFEAMRLKDSSCEDVVNSAWEEGLHMGIEFPIESCMENCCAKLEVWNKNYFGHVGKNISHRQKHLQWLEMQSTSIENIISMRDTRVELNCWLDKEDSMWHQRSRLNWFQAGDRNTSYFHSKASN
ncbi:uncharacterized protein LOC142632324 [Castanea sativa]|uniref:uncharacterized protein LOC142632324 n=1 Tax=Castanea sativa TaxID=21020 RepID=UPI003F649C40